MIIYCPHCHQDFEVEINWIGKKVNCTNCDRDFTVSKPVICPACKTPNPITTPDCLNCQNPLRSRGHLPVSPNSKHYEDLFVEKNGLGLRFWSLLPLEVILVLFPLELLILKLEISLNSIFLFLLLILGIKFAILKLLHHFCRELEDIFHNVFVFLAKLCAIASGLLAGSGLASLLVTGESAFNIFVCLSIPVIYFFFYGIVDPRIETKKMYLPAFLAALVGFLAGLFFSSLSFSMVDRG